jgi:hypothetical protein
LECHFKLIKREVILEEIQEIIIQSPTVVKIADKKITCSECGVTSPIEQAFIALACAENPELFEELTDKEKIGIRSIEEAKAIASRLILTDVGNPVLVCHECGSPLPLKSVQERTEFNVATFSTCQCGCEIDLRYPGDSARIKFTQQFPNVPFLFCISCKRRLLLPLRGKDVWKGWLFGLVRIFNNIRNSCAKYAK